MKKRLLILFLVICAPCYAQHPFDPAAHATFETTRTDGRFTSSRAVSHALMQQEEPVLSFRPELPATEFPAWQQKVGEAMQALMKHPVIADLPAPVRISVRQRDGYRIEKWEAYPLPACVVPYLMLIPDGVEAADLEYRAGQSPYDYQTFARALLELDWSYLGYASYIDLHILNWMKTQPMMQSDRLIVSGFSFGTEMLMVLGSLDSSIYAFVYNDFLCRTRERALVMTWPDSKGRRPWPNDISHLIPGFLRQFDFPDLVAVLAPRPVICTEGGLDRDFRLAGQAYALAGKPENFTYYHYKAFAEPEKREDRQVLPAGVDRDTYFRMVNVDPKNHYFKAEYVLPWIRKITGRPNDH